ncbi:MAG: imidazole glycerol phosphate synthase subunit HisH [Saprospiraceae bacterium]|nr:imidazole glycerol phosphate synthase subunit HisH [Pyrinomonadaceae bacterium]
MRVVIVKYNAGNIASVQNALSRLGVESIVSDEADVLRQADKVIFPGVGEASTAMQYLSERNLDAVIKSLTQPVLGICLGMQLLCSHSEENDTDCLGIFPTKVKKFADTNLKVPHMGWNTISRLKSLLFSNVAEGAYAYFVHGYYVEPSEDSAAQCNYGNEFTAAIQKGNFYAVQFHPEKSGVAGTRILENFLSL